MCDADYQLEAEMRSSKNTNTDEVSALWIRIPGNPMSPTLENFGLREYNPTVFDPRSCSTGTSSTNHHFEPNETSGWIFEHAVEIDRKYRFKFPGLIVWYLIKCNSYSIAKETIHSSELFILYFSHIALMEPVPLLVLYKALGLTDDQSFWKTLGISEADSALFFENLRSSMENVNSTNIKTKDEALIFIGKKAQCS